MRTTVTLDDQFVDRAGALTGVTERAALLREALKAVIECVRARCLAHLGGSKPGLAASPRATG